MSKKRRVYKDFRELGAYLQIAHEALVAASVKASRMYPKGTGPHGDIQRIEDSLMRKRNRIDNRWVKDLSDITAIGPEPIFSGVRLPEIKEAMAAIDEHGDYTTCHPQRVGTYTKRSR